MDKKRMVMLVFLALPFLPLRVLAGDDVRTLLKALGAQIAELKQQVDRSNQRIAELERKLAAAESGKHAPTAASPPALATTPQATGVGAGAGAGAVGSGKASQASKPVVTAGDVKGTFKIPGTDTSVGIGGFVKLDALYNSVSAGRDSLGDQLLVVSQVPVGRDRLGQHSRFIFHAKETRLWLQSFTPGLWGGLNTYFEMDFLGAAPTYTYTPRLRHAYGSLGAFLGGFTWTTFLDTSSIPDTLDNTGPVGALTYLRQPLARWTQPLTAAAGSPWELQMAVESPRSRLWADPANGEAADVSGFVRPNDSRYPDLVASLRYKPDWGSLSLSALGRQIRHSQPNSHRSQQAWGGALGLAGKINTAGLDNIRFMLNYGDALGRYATLNTFEDAVLDAAGEMRLVNTYGGMLAYQHWWARAWRSTLAYGFAQADQPALIDGDLTRQARSVHVNLLWSPLLQTTFGVEYIYATRTTVDGLSGDLHRVQISTRFDF